MKNKMWSQPECDQLVAMVNDKNAFHSKSEAIKEASKKFERSETSCSVKYYALTGNSEKAKKHKKKLSKHIDKNLIEKVGRISVPQGNKLMEKVLNGGLTISSMEIFPDKIVLHL